MAAYSQHDQQTWFYLDLFEHSHILTRLNTFPENVVVVAVVILITYGHQCFDSSNLTEAEKAWLFFSHFVLFFLFLLRWVQTGTLQLILLRLRIFCVSVQFRFTSSYMSVHKNINGFLHILFFTGCYFIINLYCRYCYILTFICFWVTVLFSFRRWRRYRDVVFRISFLDVITSFYNALGKFLFDGVFTNDVGVQKAVF